MNYYVLRSKSYFEGSIKGGKEGLGVQVCLHRIAAPVIKNKINDFMIFFL